MVCQMDGVIVLVQSDITASTSIEVYTGVHITIPRAMHAADKPVLPHLPVGRGEAGHLLTLLQNSVVALDSGGENCSEGPSHPRLQRSTSVDTACLYHNIVYLQFHYMQLEKVWWRF